MNAAVWAAFFGGAFGWIIRSLFDIFYLHRRDRKQVASLIRADFQSIAATAGVLRQEEFLTALIRIDAVGKDFVDRLYVTASVRAKAVDTRVIDRFGDGFSKLDPNLQSEIVSVYRALITIRLLLDRLFDVYEGGDIKLAIVIAEETVPLIGLLKSKANSLLERI
ncbi:hypothetical protein [Mameliella alba]|uniref:hypothetical protein n=1 Tax=Mameliella alba TaxID=561184 RepID=UPI00142F67AF|nr:hypothetical protein [Mameliella alba]